MGRFHILRIELKLINKEPSNNQTNLFSWFYGDPHIESLDGKQYTFNGIGEYVVMKIVNENVTFELQARTERILKENGTYSNATVFTAFAMKEENTTFQVELTEDRKSEC
ncbi:hypothetical protein KUTeg_015413 [Tegillarca granosa]|uniref:VWFD domain-containing protein n=1 Tax=Tegillarca granosa TaxID=220873 RepID=A0ABQ9EQ31_TEGGR|nr:hypothetical protein KUTeg_015413 [Tegillarca granosa]